MENNDLIKISSQQWLHLKLKGKSVKYNQLILDNQNSQTVNGVTFTNNGDGSWTVNGTATGGNAYIYLAFRFGIIGHKFFVSGCPAGGSSTTYSIYDANTGQFRDIGNSVIYTSQYEGNYFALFIVNGTTVNNLVFKPQLIDLTALGLDNITTLDQFYATDLGKLVKAGIYLPYAPNGAIQNAKAPFVFHRGVEMSSLLGKQNQLTEKVKTYYNWLVFSNGNWAYYTTSDTADEFNLIPKTTNRKYAVISKFNRIDLFRSDLIPMSNGNAWNFPMYSEYRQNNVIVSIIGNGSQTSSIHCIRYNNGQSLQGTEGIYSILIDLTELGLDNLTAQQFYNKYNHLFNKLANGETINKPIEYSRTKRVDLGSLNGWLLDNTGLFQLQLNSANFPSSASIVANIVCNKYITQKADVVRGKQVNKSISGQLGILTIYDSAYAGKTFNEIKASLSGTYLDYEPSTPLELASVNDISDTWQNWNGKVEKKFGVVKLKDLNWFRWGTVSTGAYIFYATVPNGKTGIGANNPTNVICSKYNDKGYALGGSSTSNGLDKSSNWDASNSQYLIKDTDFDDPTVFKNHFTDEDIIIYPLATPTTETAPSIMLPNNITKCTDANGMEVEFEVLNDSLNFSNKTLVGKASPTITAEKIITKGFTSAGTHYNQLYIYDDGEVWYVNGGNHATAFANNVWEIEYKTIKFDSGVELTREEKETLMKIYERK